MRININQQSYDENNFVKMDLVNLDNETFFHVEGMIAGSIINMKFYAHESDFAAKHANDVYMDFKTRVYASHIATAWRK